MAFRSRNSGVGTGTSLTVLVPTGVLDNDIVLLITTTNAAGVTFTWPLGFTELQSTSVATPNGQTAAVAWKLASGESGSYAVTASASAAWLLQSAAWVNRTNTTPTSTTNSSSASNASPVTVTATGLTASMGDDLCWVNAPDTTVSAAISARTPPTNFIERTGTTNGFSFLSFANRDCVPAVPTGTLSGTITLSSGTAGWISFLISMPGPIVSPIPMFIPYMVSQPATLISSSKAIADELSGTSHSTFSCAFAANVTAGNLLIAFLEFYDANPTITVSDNIGTGQSWTRIGTNQYDATSLVGSALFYKYNTAGSTGNRTVTASYSSNVAYVILGVQEFNGILSTANPLDQVTQLTTTSTITPTSATIIPTQDKELIICYAVPIPSADALTVGNGFTIVQADANYVSLEYLVQGLAVSVAGSYTLATASQTEMIVATFKSI